MGVLFLSLFCYALLCVLSSIAIILKRKKNGVALLVLSNRCIVTINVLWLFLMVRWVGLQCVIVVFPTYFLIFTIIVQHSLRSMSPLCWYNFFICLSPCFKFRLDFYCIPWTQGINKNWVPCKFYWVPESLVSKLIFLCPQRNFVVWMHLGMAECHVTFSGHCDLDLWPSF